MEESTSAVSVAVRVPLLSTTKPSFINKAMEFFASAPKYSNQALRDGDWIVFGAALFHISRMAA